MSEKTYKDGLNDAIRACHALMRPNAIYDRTLAGCVAAIEDVRDGAPGWVSIQLKLPPCAGHYLVWCPGSRPWIQRFTAQGRFIGGMRDEITHWMSLPNTEELPKE